MRLRDLEAEFLRYEKREDGIYHVRVDNIAEAQGVMFVCPLCYANLGKREGAHSVICWSRSRGVPEDASPGPGRWKLDGTSLDDLTLNADPPNQNRSVQLNGGCGWHGHVTNGDAA